MGIKLKNNLKEGSKLLIVIILIATILTIMCYPFIKGLGSGDISNKKNGYFASTEFSYELFESLEVIYYRNLKKLTFEERMTLPTFENMVKDKETDSTGVDETIQDHNEYNQYINRNKDTYYTMVGKSISKNIKYLIVDTDNSKWTSNLTFDEQGVIGIEDPNALRISIESFYSPNEFLDQMSYIGYINVDHNGNLQTIYSSAKINDLDRIYRGFYDQHDLKPLTDLKILYMVPNELVSRDNISDGIDRYINYTYHEGIIWISIIGVLLVCLIGIFIPDRYHSGIATKYNKVSLEIKLVIGVAAFFLFMFYTLLGTETITGHLSEELMGGLNIVVVGFLIIVLNIGMLGILYFISYITGTYIRYISKVGLKIGLFKTSWTIRNMIKGTRAFWNLMIGPETLVKPYKRIRILIGINFIIVSIISLTWFFGIGLAVIYSLILLWISRKYLKNIKEDFSKLHEFTREMEKGNLNAELEQDLGIFTSIGENLIKVKDGFQDAVEKEVRSERMKTELISNVSHDLKTPLTSIITYVDLLKSEDLDEETRQSYIEILESKSRRLKILIEDLFEASKTASGNINLEIQELDIIALMNQILGELKDKIEKSGLIFKTNFPDTKVLVHLDGRRTVRVIENLIGNSIKYALPYSRVFIDVIETEESVTLIIKNISAEEMNFTAEEIVERFSRGDTSRHTEGSGLGLAISKNLVELQGGEFQVILDGDLFKVVIIFNK